MAGLRARQVACGGYHTLIISTDDQLYACGSGNRGQLGHESMSFTSPTHIPAPFEPQSVHCGGQFSLVRATDGTLWSAGENRYGQLGLRDYDDRRQFTQIPGLVSTQAACGWSHAVAINEQHRMWVWGANHSQQLGPLKTDSAAVPTALREDIAMILLSPIHTLALTTDDQVIAYGCNAYSQLGFSTTDTPATWISTHIRPEMMQVVDRVTSRAKSARSTVPAETQ